MSTIFKCQEDIKNYLPSVSNVRIHPSLDPEYQMTVYYENAYGGFDDSLTQTIESILPAHISFNFKPYSKLKEDNIPPAPKVPELIQNLALKSTGNQKSLKNVLQKAFPELEPIIEISSKEDGITIDIKTKKVLLPDDMNHYFVYAQELIPMGCKLRLISADY